MAEEAKSFNDALVIFHTRLMRHLDYEEAHLSKWIARGAGVCDLGDHDDQRRRLLGLTHDRQVFSDPRAVAQEALAFVHLLRRAMPGEERTLRALQPADGRGVLFVGGVERRRARLARR